jgi:ABC-2 type transport system ATP-binding protein
VREFQREGRTIVLVTHALDTVTEICDRAAMLHHGELHAIGMPAEVVREMRHVLLGMADPGFVPEQGTREAEIVEVQIVRPDGSSHGAILSGDPLTIVVDVRQNEPVDDLDVDFAVHESTNYLVLDARTSRAGIDLGRFDKKRVRFKIQGFPYDPGKYWVTIGLSSRTTGHLYHVQTQRYLFEVFDAPRAQERVEVPVGIEVEDL